MPKRKESAAKQGDSKLDEVFALVELLTTDQIFADTVHSYKLVWTNGDEMDLKIVNQRGTVYAGTMPYEVQGLQVGPLLMMASIPEESRLPSSDAEDFEESLPEFIEMCRKNGVELKLLI